DLRHASASHSVPGADGAVLGGVPGDSPVHVLAGQIPVDAGTQLALRFLRWIDPEFIRPDHPLRLPGQYLQRYRRGSLRRHDHGPHGMASGRARRYQNKFARIGCAIVLGLIAGSAPAFAQGNATPPAPPPSANTAPAPAPFSQDCQIGNTAIVEASPLPHVAAALQTRKQIRILAIGAASLSPRRTGHGGLTDTIRQILQKAITGLDVVMINRGVSGELSAQAAVRIKNEVALTEPDLVLWQVGTNDALAYVPIDEFEATVVDTL